MIEYLKELIVPSNFCWLLAAIGAVLWIVPATHRRGPYVVAAAMTLLIVFSSGKTATLLLSPLEYAYPRVSDSPVMQVDAIVVLAGYAADDPDMPLSSRPNSSSLYRITEAIHLWRRCRQCTVVVTGMGTTVKVMAEVLEAAGIPKTQMHTDNQAANTAASAANMKAMLANKTFYLVTSAGHMTRAMGVFAKQGVLPIPAPTDHQMPRRVSHADWNLSPYHLQCADAAIHEYIGIAWYRLRGRM